MIGASVSPPALYLDGSDNTDLASATFSEPPSEPPRVTFELLSGSAASFDTSASAAGGCDPPEPTEVVCPVIEPPDSIVLAGLAGDDTLAASGFPATTSIVQLGGEDDDELNGTSGEDVLVDGLGDDIASAGGGDDALPNNQGDDSLSAGAGDDLFISDAVCEGDALDGGEAATTPTGRSSESAVSLDLETGAAGLVGAGGLPECEGNPPSSLHGLEDLEGSDLGDTLIGDAGSNQLLGRPGADSYFARAGDDSILANSADSDALIDCGAGFDTAQIDIPTSEYADPAPIGCEAVYERPPNSFRPPDTPPALRGRNPHRRRPLRTASAPTALRSRPLFPEHPTPGRGATPRHRRPASSTAPTGWSSPSAAGAGSPSPLPRTRPAPASAAGSTAPLQALPFAAPLPGPGGPARVPRLRRRWRRAIAIARRRCSGSGCAAAASGRSSRSRRRRERTRSAPPPRPARLARSARSPAARSSPPAPPGRSPPDRC